MVNVGDRETCKFECKSVSGLLSYHTPFRVENISNCTAYIYSLIFDTLRCVRIEVERAETCVWRFRRTTQRTCMAYRIRVEKRETTKIRKAKKRKKIEIKIVEIKILNLD